MLVQNAEPPVFHTIPAFKMRKMPVPPGVNSNLIDASFDERAAGAINLDLDYPN